MRDLAQMIADKTGTGIDYISNPRNEAAENELEVRNDKFGNLGVDFKSLDANLLEEVSFFLCFGFILCCVLFRCSFVLRLPTRMPGKKQKSSRCHTITLSETYVGMRGILRKGKFDGLGVDANLFGRGDFFLFLGLFCFGMVSRQSVQHFSTMP